MYDYTNVIYDKKTGRVLVIEADGHYVIPASCDIAHFENGVEPMLVEREDGLYFNPNAILWRGGC